MMTLTERLARAFRNWKEDKRDTRSLRDFFASPDERDRLKERVLPSTKLLMLLLERFAESDMDRVELHLRGYALCSDKPMDFHLPADVGCQWASMLASCAGTSGESGGLRQLHMTLSTPRNPVKIYCHLPKLPTPDSLEPVAETSFLVLSKSLA